MFIFKKIYILSKKYRIYLNILILKSLSFIFKKMKNNDSDIRN